LVYQGGTIGSPSTEIYLATSSPANLNNGNNWTAQSLLNPGLVTGLGLGSNADGLTLTYGNASQASDLQLSQLTPLSTSAVTVQAPTTLALPPSFTNRISVISPTGGSGNVLLLAGINTAGSGGLVQTSLVDIEPWTPPLAVPAESQPYGVMVDSLIAATGACSAVYLGQQLVVAALTAPGVITVYAYSAYGNALQVVSSFDSSDGVATDASVGLSCTPTGLALTYNNTQGSVTLNRLELYGLDGMPLAGAPLNSGGALVPPAGVQHYLLWQATVLNGISTSLASVPVSVDGTLLMVNVRDNGSLANQLWLNAVPTPADPSNAVWLNSTVQLPNSGNTGWTISQPSGNFATVDLGTTLPGWQSLSTDKAVAPPAFAYNSNTGVSYSASVDENNHIWWSSSSDGGVTWSTKLELPTSMTTEVAPALGILDDNLYLAYVGTNTDINITSLANGSASSSWATVYQLSQYALNLSMVFEGDKLAIYYLGTNDNIYRTAIKKAAPTDNNDWTGSEKIPNQTASGQIVATYLESVKTTFIAYQGGTPSDPSTTIYLGTSDNPSTLNSWGCTANIPQSSKPSASGVGLTSNSSGLILSYADVDSSNLPVLVLQQSINGTNWTPYTTLQSASLTPTPKASLFATKASNNVLVAAINTGNSWTGVNSGSSPGTPALARQSVDVVLSDTINYALGTGANVGQVLLTPAGVAYYNSNNKTLPSFTLSPLSGQNFPSSLTVSPVVIQTTATRLPVLQITPSVLTSGGVSSNSEVASYSVSASTLSTSVTLSDTTHYTLSTGKVLLTAAGVTYYNSNKSLPAFTLTPTATNPSPPIIGSAVEYTPLVLAADVSLPTLKLSAFNMTATPQTSSAAAIPPAAWTSVASFSVQGTAANTVYMAVQGNNDNYEMIGGIRYDLGDYIYWASSADNGTSWGDWQQLPSNNTTLVAPSLAMVGGTLYLGYIDSVDNGINITSLTTATSNSWSTPYQIPSSSATQLSLITENNQGSQVLSVYYVSNDGTDSILKTYSSSPTSGGWSAGEAVKYGDASDLQNQTASGPLALSQFNGQTYIAYLGGTSGSPSTDVYVTSSANAFDGSSWVLQKLDLQSNPSSKSSLGLSSNATGLTLSYGTSSNTDQLQINQYTVDTTTWSDLLLSPASPTALAWDGKSIAYTAVVGSDGSLYWTSGGKANSAEESDVAFAWNDWQQVAGATPASTGGSPSLVLLNGVLYLSYIDSTNTINITSLTSPASRTTWSTPFQLPAVGGVKVTATEAVLATEVVAGTASGQPTTQLAVYYLPPPPSSGVEPYAATLSKAFSLTPTVTNSWTTGLAIADVEVNSTTQAFGLMASQYKGQTYLLYQTSSAASPTTETTILATSPVPNDPNAWSFTQQSAGGSAETGSGIGFSGGANGLTIGYIDATRPSNLQLQLMQPAVPTWDSASVSTALPVALAESSSGLVEAISTDSGVAVYINSVFQKTLGDDSGMLASAAVIDNVVFISCLNPTDGSITLYSSPVSANSWTSYLLPNITANSAVLCNETIAFNSQLALYFVTADGTDQIFKAYSSTASPTTANDWFSAIPLAATDASGTLVPLSSSGPLSASQHGGRTYLAFQPGIGSTGTDADAIALLTSATPNASASWTNAYTNPNSSSSSPPNSPANPGQATTISLFGSAAGLGLTYGSSAEASELQSLLLLPSATAWSSQNGPTLPSGDALSAPVQLVNGISIYRVVLDTTSTKLWYSSSSNNGKSWTSWNQISGLSSSLQPSLALVGTSLFLGIVNSAGVMEIISTTNPTSSAASGPTWTSATLLSGPSASALQLIAEPVGANTQLAVYSVSRDGSGQIYKAYCSKPTTIPATWVTGIALAADAGATPLTTSEASSLSASLLNGQSYLLYQTTSTSSPTTQTTTLATSPIANNGLSWGTQTISTPSGISNLDLTTSASGLNLSYLTGSGNLQINLLGAEAAAWSSPLSGANPIVWESQLSSTAGTTTTDYTFTSMGGNAVYWRSKITTADSSSWTPWQELSPSNNPNGSYEISGQPSVALWQGTAAQETVYLAFISNGDLWLTSLTDASTNTWSAPTRIGGSTGVAASAVALLAETVLSSTGAGSGDQTLASSNQLAAYFISSGGSIAAGQIGKTFSVTPAAGSNWSAPISLSEAGSDTTSTALSATGSLSAAQLNGKTYLAYQADTAASKSAAQSPSIVLATTTNGLVPYSSNTPASNTPACNSGSNWTTQTVVTPPAGSPPLGSILLSSSETTLSLGYRLAGQPSELVVDTIGTKPPSWNPSTAFTLGASASPAALVCDSDTVYMVLQAGISLFWATGADGGSSWSGWQQVAGATPAASGGQPSLALLNGTLFLEYLDNSNDINLMSNAVPSANVWSSPALVETKASSAALVSETIGSTTQLSIYYVTSSGIEKTYSTKPSSSTPDWVTPLTLSGSKTLTSAGPLQVSQVNGQTYLAYQSSASSESLTISANSNSNSKTNWQSQSVTFNNNNAKTSGLNDFSISGGTEGLTLTAITAGLPDQLQGQLLAPTLSSTALSLKLEKSDSQTLTDGISSVASVNVQSGSANALILVGIPASSSAVSAYTSSVDPTSLAAQPWSPLSALSAATSAGPAALACSGTIFYMAAQAGDGLWWASSGDGGSTWSNWQLLLGASQGQPLPSASQPSLAVLNDILYLSYLDASNTAYITANSTPTLSNSWSTPEAIVQGVSAASLISETIITDGATVNTTAQLSLYYVNAANQQIEKTYSSSPSATPPSWSNPRVLQSGSGSSAAALTAAGPLSLALVNGQTYLAYQGPSVTNGTVTLAANPNTSNTATNWQTQNLTLSTDSATDSALDGFSLSGGSTGLTLAVTSVSQPDLLTAALLVPQLSSSGLSLSVQQTSSRTLPEGLDGVALLNGQSAFADDLLLAGLLASGTSLSALSSLENLWSPELELQGSNSQNLQLPPALARDGDTLYMAMHGDSPDQKDWFYWSFSSDSGTTWSSWQAVDPASAGAAPAAPPKLQQPALAVYQGQLVLGFVDDTNTINITTLADPTSTSPSWSTVQQLTSGSTNQPQLAGFLSLCVETIPSSSGTGSTSQLAAYYTAPTTNQINKTFTTKPTSSTSWSAPVQLGSGSSSKTTPLTASGPLTASQVNGQTYLAYTVEQAGTSTVPGGLVAQIATPATNGFSSDGSTPNVNSASGWSTQVVTSLSQQGAIQGPLSLTGDALGLQLGYGLASQPGTLQISLLAPPSSCASWSALAPPAQAVLASGTAALALSGTTLYLAVQGGTVLYWTSSSNGGTSWAGWQQVGDVTLTSDAPVQPSLAVVDGTLYLGYLDANSNINTVGNAAPGSGNNWTAPALVSGQPAASAFSLVSETISGKNQLSVYSIDTSSSELLKAYLIPSTTTSTTTSNWVSDIALKAGSGSSATALAQEVTSLTAAQIGTQTYLAYQASGSTAISIATTSTPNNTGTGWSTQGLVLPGAAADPSSYSLNGSSSGLTLTSLSASQPGMLQAALLAPQTSSSSSSPPPLILLQTTSLGLPAGITSLASLSDPLSTTSTNLVLAGIDSSGFDSGSSSPSLATTSLANFWSPSSLVIQQTTSQWLPQNMNGDAVTLISAPGYGDSRQLVMVGSQYTAGAAQIQSSQIQPWNPELPIVLSTTPLLPTTLPAASTSVSGQSSSSVLTLVGSGTGGQLQSNTVDGFTGQLTYAQPFSISLPSSLGNTNVSVLVESAGTLVLAGSDPSASSTGSAVQTSTVASPWAPTFVADPNDNASPSLIANLGNITLINTSAKDILVTAVNIDSTGEISKGSSIYSNGFDPSALNALVTQVPGTNTQYLGPYLSNTNIAILSTNNSVDAANSNGVALIGAGINNAANGNLVQTSLFTPAGSQVQSIQAAIVQERPSSFTLSADQTGSTLIPVGDLNGDGYADLLVSANNVVVQTGVNSQSLGTGLRLISGAGSSSQIQSLNNVTDTKQQVQVAAPFSLSGTTPVARRTGPNQLTLSSLGPAQQLASSIGSPGTATYALQSIAGADSFLASNLATAYNVFLQGATPTAGAPSLLAAASLAVGSTSGSFGDLNADGRLDYFSPNPDQAILYDAYGTPWQVWAARAVGDFNGNGTDDVLLTLLPSSNANDLYTQLVEYLDANNVIWSANESLTDYLQALKQGVKDFVVTLDPSLQPVLLDGALFQVRNNSFAFTDLRTPLNPTGGLHYQSSETIGLSGIAPLGIGVLADQGDAGQTALLAAVASNVETRLVDLVSPWSTVDRRASANTPALVRQGNNIYMAVMGDTNEAGSSLSINWTYSTDGGLNWGPWATIPGNASTEVPPSLAVVNNTLYLSYIALTSNDLYITSLGLADTFTNNWSVPYQIPGQSVRFATLTTETINDIEQLAVYYVSSDSNNGILKAYSTTPSSSESWTTDVLYSSSGVQTASSPIAASQAFGRTYLAYMGGTTRSPSTEIFMAYANGPVNDGNQWTAQALLDAGFQNGVGLTTSGQGLSLSYFQGTGLQINLLIPHGPDDSLSSVLIDTVPAQMASNVAISYGSGSNAPPQMLLAGITSPSTGSLVQTSVIEQWDSWEPQSSFTAGARPLLARSGGVITMATQIQNSTTLGWCTSLDGGRSWSDWQNLPAAITSNLFLTSAVFAQSLSMAVFKGTVYISFITSSNSIAITALTDPESNSWSTPVILPGDPCFEATLVAESVNGVEQLAVYAVADDDGAILKNYSSTPASSTSWTVNVPILDSQGSAQTSPGPLAATSYLGSTYLTYQGGAAARSSTALVLATSPANGLNNGANWTAQSLNDPGSAANLGLSSSPRGLLLSYSLLSGSGLVLNNLSPGEATEAPLDPLQNWIQTGDGAWSVGGYSIDGNVDLNGDGFSDLLISEPTAIQVGVVNKDDPTGRGSTDANAGVQYGLFGGDWLGIASQVGTSGDDLLVGTSLADVFYTLQGDDKVFSHGGADVITTGAGNDQISITDNAFIRIDGGEGVDLLQLQGLLDQSYDFRLDISTPQYFMGTKLRNIEQISSIAYGANQLSFDAQAINASNAKRLLLITPDSNDLLVLTNEFARNPAFDTNFEGSLYAAYAAYAGGTQNTSTNSNPALLLVRPPGGESTDAWLGQHVQIADSIASDTQPSAAVPMSMAAVPPPGATAPAVVPSAVVSRQAFGDNLTLEAYRNDASEGLVRFRISRSIASTTQVVQYSSSSLNSLALPGKDYDAVMGCLVFAPGQTSKTITIPVHSKAITDLLRPTVSLQVQEVSDRNQQEQHLIIEPLFDDLAADVSLPVLTAFTLTPSEGGSAGLLTFRADSNDPGELANLRLRVSQRPSSDSTTLTQSRDFSIRDFSKDANSMAASEPYKGLPLDHDRRANQQVSVQLQLNFEADVNGPIVSVLGPELAPAATVELVNTNQVHFLQDAPLTSWRADSSAGYVSFALVAGATRQALLSDAEAGSSGSINPNNALAYGWQNTESKAIGSRSITAVPNLSAQAWTPTASRDGVSLALLNLSVNGNQVTASFAGGVTGVFWQASGNDPTLLPVPASLEVQRLTSYNNSLGFYSVDAITGLVDNLLPGDPGYLQAALARSEHEDLLIDANHLPGHRQSIVFNNLPLDTQKRYGVLLLQDSSRTTIFSSYAAANPMGQTQMVRLNSDSDKLTLGIEDLAIASGISDTDFNDLILNLTGVSIPLF